MSSEGKLKSLENISFMNPKEKLNSPRSLEALGILGIDPHKLYYVSFDDFMYMHPELKHITKDLQEKRYNHYEKKRKEKISNAKQKRNDLIEANKNKTVIKSKSLADYTKEQASTMIKSEREKLRLLKIQQMGELKNMIEFEFKMEEIRQKNEHKMQLQQQREEELRKLRIEQAKEREIKQKMQERKKEERIKAEMEEQERKEKERREEDHRQYLEEMKRNEQMEKERRRRQEESKKRQQEFRQKIEGILNAQQNELIERQKEMLRKEEQRKKNLEEYKKEIQQQNQEKKRKTKERIQKALMRNDSAFLVRQTDFERKQKIAEEIRQKFAQERMEKVKQQEILNKQKEQEILEVLKRNDEIIQRRIEAYNKKQAQIEERQKERDIIQARQKREKHIRMCQKEQKCIEARERNKEIMLKNREKLILKINSSDEKINKQKGENVRLKMERFIEESIRKDDIKDNIREKENAMEFIRIQRLNELEEKSKKVEEMKMQKLEIYEQRRKMNRELQKSKERMLIKFDYLMKNNKTKTKEEIMKELFEDDYVDMNKSTKQRKSAKIHCSRSATNVNDPMEQVKILQSGNKGDFEFLTNVQPPQIVTKRNENTETSGTKKSEENAPKEPKKEEKNDTEKEKNNEAEKVESKPETVQPPVKEEIKGVIKEEEEVASGEAVVVNN